MWLVSFPKCKVKREPKGWVVLIQKEINFLFFKVKYWTHIESVYGRSNKPWFYSTRDMAISEAVKHFEWDLLINSRGE